MNHRLKQSFKRLHAVKRLTGWSRARKTRALGLWWQKLLDLDEATQVSVEGNPRVLLATSLGAYQPASRLDSLLAMALKLRGAEPHVFLCDSFLPACQLVDAYFYPNQGKFLSHGSRHDVCRTCTEPTAAVFEALDVPVHQFSSYVADSRRHEIEELAAGIPAREISGYRSSNIAVGEHALAGALRFFASGSLDREPRGEEVLRSYFRAALLTAEATRGLLDEIEFDNVVLHHGLYVPQGIICEKFRARGARVATWHPAYRRGCFTFSEDNTYHKTFIDEPTAKWEEIPWTSGLDSSLMEYLESRRCGSRDWISFNRQPIESLEEISSSLGLDPNKPWIGMLTNVLWDAQLHYAANAFPSLLDWTVRTIEYFAGRQDLQLIIRAHPAEVSGQLPARQTISDELTQAFSVLPDNVFVIPAESQISTYEVMLNCDTVLIYATKMGIELSAFGVPVVVAGEAWIRNKGFSFDTSTPEEYFELLNQLPLNRRLDEPMKERARKYAYHYFFRRMIPLEFVQPGRGGLFGFDLRLDSIDSLAPGRSLGLDVICDGILNGADFIYPAESCAVGGKEATSTPLSADHLTLP